MGVPWLLVPPCVVHTFVGGVGCFQETFVTMLSVCNCLGRLFAGYLSDRYAKYVTKELLLVVFAAMMSCSHLVLMGANINLLYLGCIMTGTKRVRSLPLFIAVRDVGWLACLC